MTKPFRIGIVGAASSFTFIFADALKEEAPADIEFAGMTYLDRDEKYIRDSTNLPWLTKYPKTIAGYVQTYGVPAYETFEELVEQGRPPIALVSPDIRPALKHITASHIPQLVVLSYAEITPDTRIEAVTRVLQAA